MLCTDITNILIPIFYSLWFFSVIVFVEVILTAACRLLDWPCWRREQCATSSMRCTTRWSLCSSWYQHHHSNCLFIFHLLSSCLTSSYFASSYLFSSLLSYYIPSLLILLHISTLLPFFSSSPLLSSPLLSTILPLSLQSSLLPPLFRNITDLFCFGPDTLQLLRVPLKTECWQSFPREDYIQTHPSSVLTMKD